MARSVNRFSSPSSPSLHHFCFLSKNTMQIHHSLALKQGMMEGVKAYTTSTSIACLDSLQNESKDYFSLYKMLFECSQCTLPVQGQIEVMDILMKDPHDFICPLTGQLFEDPVTRETGQTFEREAIGEWFDQGNRRCPVTGKTLACVQPCHLPTLF